ncbi:MAG: TraB/GumN family protein [Planctomycetaceae bacterium]
MKWFSILAALVLILPTHESHALQATKQQDEKAAKTEEASKEKPKQQFIRLRKEGRWPVAMETNIVRYTDSIKHPGVTVDLIGAIHIADPQYFKKLNELFTEYDVLLFEAVKDENAEVGGGKPHRGGAVAKNGDMSTDTMVGLSTIGMLQSGMTDMLGLAYQMEGIDYTKKNFVHADMTTQEFQKSMSARGESFGGMMMKEMAKSMGKQTGNPIAQQLDLMLSMMSKDPQVKLRRIAAKELAKAGAEEAFSDENGESTIITERNKKALQVLDEQLDKGHKKIGIFYGAAHMPDMEKRLMQDFYFTRGDVKWLSAWKLRTEKKNAKKAAQPAAK